ncbi:hypothetical protein WOLCODRAFT_157258 [Wolfiporia cocos MD-104 SS10]|uniref:F-box domain-containing protein n=1 Tax=Wolfiporia cocos (strain MD-104) TaxID=742152 RepID=A0A2H3J9S5_WOLCO|nr:hypothetical protein WOLCODRAFT_157258 [Wolfiporia cocos MD-104 SS10]
MPVVIFLIDVDVVEILGELLKRIHVDVTLTLLMHSFHAVPLQDGMRNLEAKAIEMENLTYQPYDTSRITIHGMKRLGQKVLKNAKALVAAKEVRLKLRGKHLPPWSIGNFVYCETPSGPHPSRVPIEIWEHILDTFQDQLDVMGVCGRVCRAWRAVSRCYTRTYRFWTLNNPIDVMRFSQLREEDGAIGSLAHIALLVAMLAGNVPRAISQLVLQGGEWVAGIPQSVFLHLSTFTSIRHLTLFDVTLPSIAVTGGII